MKDSFCKVLKHVFNQFLKYHMKILLHFNAKVGREDIFTPTIGNESLHKINSNRVRIIDFPISKYTWTSCDGKTQQD
jgi:hypothetical protein